MKRLQYSSYYDKVLGGWLGKCVGGSLGAPTEGIKEYNNTKYYSNSDKAQIANDDLDIQLVWVHALKQRGVDLSARDLMEEWIDHVKFPWSEYGYALRNFRAGICPPESGRFNNSFYGESMGCPIRSEIWGMVSPGSPELAASFAEKDGSLDHFGNSVYAEKFLAAIEAAAFVETDIRELLKTGLSVIPSKSRLAECVSYVIECFDKGMPLTETRRLLLSRFGHPDFTSVLQNLGFITIGLLYGQNDFESTLLNAINCGYDTDCTGATAGAIMGIILGAKRLPAKWTDPIGSDIVSLLKIEELLDEPILSNLAKETCDVGLALSLGGKTDLFIDNPPSDSLDVASALLDKPRKEISVDIEYLSKPSISFSEPANVRIKIKNLTNKEVHGSLDLDLPDHLISSINRVEFFIHGMDMFYIDLTISLRSKTTELPLANRIAYRCTYNDKRCKGTFGISGAAQWLVMGPFWETFPDSAIKPGKYYAHDTLSLPPYEAMVLNTAYLEKEYIPEPKSELDMDELLAHIRSTDRVIINSHEDKCDLDRVFTLAGPQVVYLYREIKCTEERKAWIVMGANDGVKLWVNGVKCLSSIDRMYTFPGHHSVEVTLKEGVNSILVKVMRSGANYDFSFAIKEHHERHWHQEQHMVDYLNVLLSRLEIDELNIQDEPVPEVSTLLDA